MSAGYKRTVTALLHDDDDAYCISVMFEVPDKGFDLLKGIKEASEDFLLNTSEGEDAFMMTDGYWDLADFDQWVPDSFCEKHGFKKISSDLADIEVDEYEQFIDRDMVAKRLNQ